ncbi:MAG: HAMP domain-containing histidine kinase [Synergistaceae bacterium]|nr:HAMP domain-containing histidine kinase [Synergistaceae bacterium]
MRIALKTRLVLSYVVMALFLVCSLLVVSNYYLQKQFQLYVLHKQDMKNAEIVETVSKNYAGTPADAASWNFLAGYGESLLEQGVTLMVLDASGIMIYCAADEERGCSHPPFAEDADARCQDIDAAYSRSSFDITSGDEVIGAIQLGYHSPFYYNESDQSFLSAFNRVFGGTAALSFAASVALGLVMAGLIARPIVTVTERARRIAEGEYSGDFEKTGTIEIDELSGSVDHLARSLETQHKLKKRMAGAYSHEFRTPLTVLQSNIEAMIDGLWQPTKERLESLLAEISRMSRMVSEVDNLVQAGNPEAKLEKTPQDISVLARCVLSGFEAKMAEKGISLRFDGGRCLALVDPDKFSQIIANLVSNALKYTDPGGNIWVRVSADGGHTVLSVEDDGIGIAESDMPYIFEHLYRTDESRARDSGGNGIGLSVARAIAESHGGTIEARSQPGKGSVFTLSIPVEWQRP